VIALLIALGIVVGAILTLVQVASEFVPYVPPEPPHIPQEPRAYIIDTETGEVIDEL